jgi:hypothetical protein
MTTDKAITAWEIADPEFVDVAGLHRLFGIKRSLAYVLLNEGSIKSVSLRRRGAVRRGKGFTGTEVKELQEEFRKLSGYHGQGRVMREGDMRLKANKKKKLAELEKARKAKQPMGRPRTKPKIVFFPDLTVVEAKQASGGKTPKDVSG